MPSLEALLECARAYVSEHVPWRSATFLCITLDDGAKIKHPIPNWPLPVALAAPTGQPERLSELEAEVLQAVSELGGSPKGAAIAERVGCPYDSPLKVRLSSLRRRNLLGGTEGSTGGYPLTEKGRAALAPGAVLPPEEHQGEN